MGVDATHTSNCSHLGLEHIKGSQLFRTFAHCVGDRLVVEKLDVLEFRENKIEEMLNVHADGVVAHGKMAETGQPLEWHQDVAIELCNREINVVA